MQDPQQPKELAAINFSTLLLAPPRVLISTHPVSGVTWLSLKNSLNMKYHKNEGTNHTGVLTVTQ